MREKLKARGLMTESAVFQALADAQSKRPTPAYDAAVVDEAQDISIAQLRFLAALAGGRPNGLFFSATSASASSSSRSPGRRSAWTFAADRRPCA